MKDMQRFKETIMISEYHFRCTFEFFESIIITIIY